MHTYPFFCCRTPVDPSASGLPGRIGRGFVVRGAGVSQNRSSAAGSLRSGFTLVELLVVIVIIGILMALILPAINSAKIKANEARVTVEIKNLEQALGAFKTKFGIEPPSRFVIHLTANGWNNDAANKATVRRLWSQFDFSMNGASAPGGQAYPSNWDTIASNQGHSEYIGINSGECLMFFIGGIIGNNGAPIGFCKNPAYPFSPNGTSREPPFMELDAGRIRDSDNNGMPEYFDSIPNQQNPYLYFSSYEGRGYRSPNVTGFPQEFPVGTLQDIYRVNKTVVTPPGNNTYSLTAHRAQSFQIISPGYDGDYGAGGVFNPDLPSGGLTAKGDYDNLTNFHGSRLSP
ncbi:MAG: type II secretion system protein [Planctomycetales bacterium]